MTNTENYRICSRCVMDTSDPEIHFDENGVCNHCKNFDLNISPNMYNGQNGLEKIRSILNRVRSEGKNNEYDCILGLSGGVDSSYLALMLKEYDLKPLVVHVDAGWNSELAVHNIEQLVKYCNYDLFTHVMNWKEIKDLQLAYLKAGVANQDVVQDHAFFASLYNFAVKNKIKYVINGGNYATESVFPGAWNHSAMDGSNLKSIHEKHGKLKLKDFKTIGFFKYYIYYPFIKKMTVIRPLNYLGYDKGQALKELKEVVGYKEYGRKHGESRFTKFFQNYYLPHKFGYDKRRPHLASQILSKEITRDQALTELQKPLYNQRELEDDLKYVAKKLGLKVDELISLIEGPNNHYSKFDNWDNQYRLLIKIKDYIGKYTDFKVKGYS